MNEATAPLEPLPHPHQGFRCITVSVWPDLGHPPPGGSRRKAGAPAGLAAVVATLTASRPHDRVGRRFYRPASTPPAEPPHPTIILLC